MINKDVIEKVGNLVRERLGFDFSKETTAGDVIRYVVFQQLVKLSIDSTKLLRIGEYVEILRALADGMELVEKEGIKKS